ncbi:hypothetical protein Tco_0005426 [Tanacetum coccineum]
MWMSNLHDIALNVDNVFQADDCDAYDSDVDEAPTAQTMFMTNLSSADPVCDEAGPSYYSDIFSELKYQNLKDSFQNKPSSSVNDTPDFNSVFVIGQMKASLQGKDNVIQKLKMKISQLKETRSELDRTLDFRARDFQISQLTEKVVQIVLWYLDSGCSKHMMGDRSRLMNFVKKFIGTVRFGNDHFGAIMGYGDYVVGDSVISGLLSWKVAGINLFLSVNFVIRI